MGVAYLVGLCNTHCSITLLTLKLAAVSKAMPTAKVSPWREFLQIWWLSSSIDTLAVRCENCCESKIFVEIFSRFMPSSSTPVSSTTVSSLQFRLLLFRLLSIFTSIFNSNLMWNLMCYGYTYIQVYNFLNTTQLLSALIYSCKEYSLFENFVFSLFSFCLNTRLVGFDNPTCLKL